MKRRAFLMAPFGIFSAIQDPLPGFEVLGHRRFRGRTKHVAHLDEYAYFEGPLPHRRLYEHFYNQSPIVNRAIDLHAEFPLSSLT